MAKASAYFTNIVFRGEEVAELDAQIDVGIHRLLVRQLDVAADREPARLVAAPVAPP